MKKDVMEEVIRDTISEVGKDATSLISKMTVLSKLTGMPREEAEDIANITAKLVSNMITTYGNIECKPHELPEFREMIVSKMMESYDETKVEVIDGGINKVTIDDGNGKPVDITRAIKLLAELKGLVANKARSLEEDAWPQVIDDKIH